MKNLKNMAAAASLMVVMGFGAVSANAGLLISDRAASTPKQCTAQGGILQQLAGVYNALSGLIISDRDGIIIIDKASTGCAEGNGMLVSDRDGIIIIDKQ